MGDVREPLRLVQRASTNDDATGAGFEEPLHRIGRPHTAPDLHVSGGVADHFFNYAGVGTGADGCVDVDHVKPPKAELRPNAGCRHWTAKPIATIHVRAQPRMHAFARAKIQRRNYEHLDSASPKH